MSHQCYHCNLPVPAGEDYRAEVKGEIHHFCCPGCRAVAQTITGLGFEKYYDKRDGYSASQDLDGDNDSDLSWLDDPQFLHPALEQGEGFFQVDLQLLGISCAACVWLIENHLQLLPGVRQAHVSQATQRARIVFDRDKLPLSRLFNEIQSLGYQVVLARDADAQRANQKETIQQLIRLGVAAIGMMQVGMYAIALHAGSLQGISDLQRDLMRQAALIITTLVVFISSRVFFQNAWHALKQRQLVMDVPVATAIGLAYAASLVATFGGIGEVYFDSVVMFTFFLLLSRFLERQARNRVDPQSLQSLIPDSVERVTQGKPERVALSNLQVGDQLRVRAGQRIPVDGLIIQGSSELDESVLTGEFEPQKRRPGDRVIAGSLNGEAELVLEVASSGQDTLLSRLDSLAEQASFSRTPFMGIADRWAGRFIAAVLGIALASSLIWLTLDPTKAFWIGLSVLVVACPCALSLATPVSFAAAIAGLRKMGVLVRTASSLERLAETNHLVLDKTGTLTTGNASIQRVQLFGDMSQSRARGIAGALERHSSHPFARAFPPVGDISADQVRVLSGQGIEGVVDGKTWRIGKPDFALGSYDETAHSPEAAACTEDPGLSQVYLSGDSQLEAVFYLEDSLRPSAKHAIAELKKRFDRVSLLSGDPSARVGLIADLLGIDEAHAGMEPACKLEMLKAYRDAGDRILYVGDGINDLPALGQADVSVTLGDAPDLVKSRTDLGLMGGDLRALVRLMNQARRVKYMIRQNVTWALLYNFSAIPAAAMGWVPPWLAAIGMSLSSLIVVLNALRLARVPRNK